ncbi:hypothetical protein EDD16DRAFT_1526603 [Pisolithus croceorrhizus]|nr:hypothetical protein EDD16DRAFT_1526603 [Pisolithus croceorrhizus]KAI6165632.1 hypothetical protein EDD17DRAFT_1505668 [Pisolithus thermaeus]
MAVDALNQATVHSISSDGRHASNSNVRQLGALRQAGATGLVSQPHSHQHELRLSIGRITAEVSPRCLWTKDQDPTFTFTGECKWSLMRMKLQSSSGNVYYFVNLNRKQGGRRFHYGQTTDLITNYLLLLDTAAPAPPSVTCETSVSPHANRSVLLILELTVVIGFIVFPGSAMHGGSPTGCHRLRYTDDHPEVGGSRHDRQDVMMRISDPASVLTLIYDHCGCLWRPMVQWIVMRLERTKLIIDIVDGSGS